MHWNAPRLGGVGGRWFVLAAAACFAVNGSVSKLVLQAGMPADRLTALRCTGAALGLFLILGVTRPRSLRVGLHELPLLIACGICGAAMVQWLYFVAIARLPVGVALLLEFTAPVLIAVWTRFGVPLRGRRPVHRRVWGALTLVLAGLALLAEVWDGLTLDPVGLAAGMGAAAALASFYLLAEHGLGRRDGPSLAAWMFAIGALFWAVVSPWWTFPVGLLAAPTAAGLPVWALCLAVVVFGTIVPYVLTAAALRRMPATGVSITGTVEPVLAGLVAWLALGEVLGPAQLAGAAVVLSGILLAQAAANVPTHPAVLEREPAIVR